MLHRFENKFVPGQLPDDFNWLTQKSNLNYKYQLRSIMGTKKLFAIIAILLSVVDLTAQQATTFTVIKVSGKVYSNALKREVTSKDVLKTSDNLTFHSKASYLHVVNPEMGRKTFRNVPDNSPREFMQLLNGFLSQDKKSKTSRGAASKGIEELIDQLSYDTLLILSSGRIFIDTTETSLKKPAGMLATYRMDGNKVDRIISDNSGFNLGKSYLFGGIGAPYPKVVVNYCEDTADPFFSPIIMLGSFVPFYVDEELLKIEVKTIIDAFQTKPSSVDVVKQITEYLSSEYAFPIHENVTAWLQSSKLMP